MLGAEDGTDDTGECTDEVAAEARERAVLLTHAEVGKGRHGAQILGMCRRRRTN